MTKKSLRRRLQPIVCLLLLLLIAAAPAAADEPVVRAVLFFSPNCGHCHTVITEVLPPLVEKHGDQLQILAVNVTVQQGYDLFIATIEQFGLDPRGTVPTLIVGETSLVGGRDIPEQFPAIIEQGLSLGGIDWPDIPGLEVVIEQALGETALPQAPSKPASAKEAFMRDTVGSSLAVVVLAGMASVVTLAGVRLAKKSAPSGRQRFGWIVGVLCLMGLAVAGYLAYVEITETDAVCGPVGDCNTVQQSEYARLFGVIPVGFLGIVGYAAMLIAWYAAERGSGRWSEWGAAALLGMALGATLFSIYLTILEPFVIGATCAWCLSSAVIAALILWRSVDPGLLAWSRLRGAEA